MPRKQARTVEQPPLGKSVEQAFFDAKHRKFANHSLFVAVLSATALHIGQRYKRGTDARRKTIRDEAIMDMGMWLFALCGRPIPEVKRELAGLSALIENFAKMESFPFELRAIISHAHLQNELRRHPSFQELKAEVGGGDSNDDNRTLRRVMKRHGLPLFNHRSIKHFRIICEKLNNRGTTKMDPAKLRRELKKRATDKQPSLPESNDELIAFCAACGARLDKRQFLTAFFRVLQKGRKKGNAPTDSELWYSLPKRTLDDYNFKTPDDLRSYAESIGLRLTRDSEWIWLPRRPPK